MPDKVFYSFHYKGDASRIQQVIQMGAVEGQQLLTGQKWEEVEKKGKAAVEKWIDEQMRGKKCLVVLVGAQTAGRPWVQHEIKKAWGDKLGVVGIRIHGLKDLNTQLTSTKGTNPFSSFNVNGTPFDSIVTCYDPPGADSKAVYASISNNIESLVQQAIKTRARFN
ncbi:TIR domain-containing protein [Bradyrhizobium sp. SZCCHNS3004]|uniref:TIR domain-containing protein n=1 Tax=Bradyrhizobium sp. SZCCHNS3004 TaxID=3057312 RepID=UPI002915FFBE|nr:TIR domain-containing protein [Bradyrhizobium sp. SZCCHNS3004]